MTDYAAKKQESGEIGPNMLSHDTAITTDRDRIWRGGGGGGNHLRFVFDTSRCRLLQDLPVGINRITCEDRSKEGTYPPCYADTQGNV